MIFKVLLGLSLTSSPLMAQSSEVFSCDVLDAQSTQTQSILINDDLYIVVTSNLIKNRGIENTDSITIKKNLMLGLYQYFKKLENWNHLEIKSSGGVFEKINCDRKPVFYTKTNLKNISVVRLSKPSGDSLNSNIDGFLVDEQLVNKFTFDQFK
jgi:hypothetical protein